MNNGGTFHGRPCSRCGGTERYVNENRCVQCRRLQGKVKLQREDAERRARRLTRIKKWGKDNPKKFHATQAKYRQTHMEAVKKRHALYQATHVRPAASLARRLWEKEYRAAHSKENKAYRKAYLPKQREKQRAERLAHPELHKERVAKRRAIKERAIVGDPAQIRMWITSWQRKKSVVCYWCNGAFPPKKCHVDHIIPLSKGGAHTINNLCVSCPTCNLSKNNKLPAIWNLTLNQPRLFL